MVHRVVEHLRVALFETKHGGERVPLSDARDAQKLGTERRPHRRVGVGVEREFDIRRRDPRPVLPARAGVDVEHERQRPVPFPLLREQRLKVFIADGVLGRADVGQLQKQLLVDVIRDDVFARRGQQRPRLGDRGVDECAAPGAGATAAALTSGNCDDNETDEAVE